MGVDCERIERDDSIRTEMPEREAPELTRDIEGHSQDDINRAEMLVEALNTDGKFLNDGERFLLDRDSFDLKVIDDKGLSRPLEKDEIEKLYSDFKEKDVSIKKTIDDIREVNAGAYWKDEALLGSTFDLADARNDLQRSSALAGLSKSERKTVSDLADKISDQRVEKEILKNAINNRIQSLEEEKQGLRDADASTKDRTESLSRLNSETKGLKQIKKSVSNDRASREDKSLRDVGFRREMSKFRESDRDISEKIRNADPRVVVAAQKLDKAYEKESLASRDAAKAIKGLSPSEARQATALMMKIRHYNYFRESLKNEMDRFLSMDKRIADTSRTPGKPNDKKDDIRSEALINIAKERAFKKELGRNSDVEVALRDAKEKNKLLNSAEKYCNAKTDEERDKILSRLPNEKQKDVQVVAAAIGDFKNDKNALNSEIRKEERIISRSQNSGKDDDKKSAEEAKMRIDLLKIYKERQERGEAELQKAEALAGKDIDRYEKDIEGYRDSAVTAAKSASERFNKSDDNWASELCSRLENQTRDITEGKTTDTDISWFGKEIREKMNKDNGFTIEQKRENMAIAREITTDIRTNIALMNMSVNRNEVTRGALRELNTRDNLSLKMIQERLNPAKPVADNSPIPISYFRKDVDRDENNFRNEIARSHVEEREKASIQKTALVKDIDKQIKRYDAANQRIIDSKKISEERLEELRNNSEPRNELEQKFVDNRQERTNLLLIREEISSSNIVNLKVVNRIRTDEDARNIDKDISSKEEVLSSIREEAKSIEKDLPKDIVEKIREDFNSGKLSVNDGRNQNGSASPQERYINLLHREKSTEKQIRELKEKQKAPTLEERSKAASDRIKDINKEIKSLEIPSSRKAQLTKGKDPKTPAEERFLELSQEKAKQKLIKDQSQYLLTLNRQDKAYQDLRQIDGKACKERISAVAEELNEAKNARQPSNDPKGPELSKEERAALKREAKEIRARIKTRNQKMQNLKKPVERNVKKEREIKGRSEEIMEDLRGAFIRTKEAQTRLSEMANDRINSLGINSPKDGDYYVDLAKTVERASLTKKEEAMLSSAMAVDNLDQRLTYLREVAQKNPDLALKVMPNEYENAIIGDEKYAEDRVRELAAREIENSSLSKQDQEAMMSILLNKDLRGQLVKQYRSEDYTPNQGKYALVQSFRADSDREHGTIEFNNTVKIGNSLDKIRDAGHGVATDKEIDICSKKIEKIKENLTPEEKDDLAIFMKEGKVPSTNVSLDVLNAAAYSLRIDELKNDNNTIQNGSEISHLFRTNEIPISLEKQYRAEKDSVSARIEDERILKKGGDRCREDTSESIKGIVDRAVPYCKKDGKDVLKIEFRTAIENKYIFSADIRDVLDEKVSRNEISRDDAEKIRSEATELYAQCQFLTAVYDSRHNVAFRNAVIDGKNSQFADEIAFHYTELRNYMKRNNIGDAFNRYAGSPIMISATDRINEILRINNGIRKVRDISGVIKPGASDLLENRGVYEDCQRTILAESERFQGKVSDMLEDAKEMYTDVEALVRDLDKDFSPTDDAEFLLTTTMLSDETKGILREQKESVEKIMEQHQYGEPFSNEDYVKIQAYKSALQDAKNEVDMKESTEDMVDCLQPLLRDAKDAVERAEKEIKGKDDEIKDVLEKKIAVPVAKLGNSTVMINPNGFMSIVDRNGELQVGKTIAFNALVLFGSGGLSLTAFGRNAKKSVFSVVYDNKKDEMIDNIKEEKKGKEEEKKRIEADKKRYEELQERLEQFYKNPRNANAIERLEEKMSEIENPDDFKQLFDSFDKLSDKYESLGLDVSRTKYVANVMSETYGEMYLVANEKDLDTWVNAYESPFASREQKATALTMVEGCLNSKFDRLGNERNSFKEKSEKADKSIYGLKKARENAESDEDIAKIDEKITQRTQEKEEYDRQQKEIEQQRDYIREYLRRLDHQIAMNNDASIFPQDYVSFGMCRQVYGSEKVCILEKLPENIDGISLREDQDGIYYNDLTRGGYRGNVGPSMETLFNHVMN